MQFAIAGDFDRPDLPALLEELASMPLSARAPHLGFLDSTPVAPSPFVRVGALRALAGANGRLAFLAYLRALDDDSDEVRRAAVESFAKPAQQQGARWIHMLFHPRADVRQLALEALPLSRRPHALPLVADPVNGDRVRAWFADDKRPRLPEDGLPLLLALHRKRLVDARALSLLLSDADASSLARLFHAGRHRDEARATITTTSSSPRSGRPIREVAASARRPFARDARSASAWRTNESTPRCGARPA